MINEGNKFIHWNHFLSLEKDLETISRYVELTSDNNNTYSIELAKLLFATSSEFDVVMKELCKLLAPSKPRNNINDYRKVIKTEIPNLIPEVVFINRFGIDFQPFLNWQRDENPVWWQSYNKVKHNRVEHYSKANLKNTLNAIGALLIVTTYFYKYSFEKESTENLHFATVHDKLRVSPNLLSLNKLYYPVDMIIP